MVDHNMSLREQIKKYEAEIGFEPALGDACREEDKQVKQGDERREWRQHVMIWAIILVSGAVLFVSFIRDVAND